MKINYTFLFAIPIILVLLVDNMFIELIAPNNLDMQGAVLNLLIKGIAGGGFVYCTVFFMSMSKPMRVAYLLTTCYFLALVFESKYKYGTYLVYPHVFLKIQILYYSFFVYTFYKRNYYVKTSHIVYFILIGYWLNVLVVHPDTLSVSAFTSNERGVYSSSVYMIIIPFLYYLSNYFYKGSFTSLLLAFFMLFTIFFFQHRTVWISTAFVLVVYYLLIRFRTAKPINFMQKLLPVAGVVAVLAFICSAFILSMKPEIIDRVQESFSDIENFESQGTGGWRYTQWTSYLPFIEQNWVTGMRFEGFELPIQFYRDDLDAPVFEDGNGHHFHSHYIDVLFYVGMLGMLLYILIMSYPLRQAFVKKHLTVNQIILVSFVTSGFVFGISYVLPGSFYAILGWCLAAIEEEKVPQISFLKESGQRMHARRLQERERFRNVLQTS